MEPKDGLLTGTSYDIISVSWVTGNAEEKRKCVDTYNKYWGNIKML